jgi:hypothetical protein
MVLTHQAGPLQGRRRKGQTADPDGASMRAPCTYPACTRRYVLSGGIVSCERVMCSCKQLAFRDKKCPAED